MDTKKRIDSMDLMKAIAVIAMIVLHAPLLNYDFFSSDSSARVIQYALRLVTEPVPIFLFVNGFLMLRKKELDVKKHYKKTLKLIGIFFFWALVLIFAGALLSKPSEKLTIRKIYDYVIATRIGARHTGVLWFIQNFVALYMIYPVIKLVYDKRFDIYKWFFYILAFFTVGLGTSGYVLSLIEIKFDMKALRDGIDFLYRFNPFGNAWFLFYFMLGGMILHYEEEIRKRKKLFIFVGLVTWAVSFLLVYKISLSRNIVFDTGMMYHSLLCFFIIGLYAATSGYISKNKIGNKFILSLSINSLGIYVSHFIFVFVSRRFFGYIKLTDRLIDFMIVFLGGYLLVIILKRIPVIKKTVIM